ncbi:hypothetical protein BCR43DRAFT_351737 [Syncephalastrum racemosum]|uniref:Uncharacterized protein n=1 Tax=Syncephalastrum racemosum TaxID=13706 RepID=A0A1X2H7I6_SYNRA|nr:hypothetical protein BCR43DRAFT_351737 [Syncephalastrum racemosum]
MTSAYTIYHTHTVYSTHYAHTYTHLFTNKHSSLRLLPYRVICLFVICTSLRSNLMGMIVLGRQWAQHPYPEKKKTSVWSALKLTRRPFDHPPKTTIIARSGLRLLACFVDCLFLLRAD